MAPRRLIVLVGSEPGVARARGLWGLSSFGSAARIPQSGQHAACSQGVSRLPTCVHTERHESEKEQTATICSATLFKNRGLSSFNPSGHTLGKSIAYGYVDCPELRPQREGPRTSRAHSIYVFQTMQEEAHNRPKAVAVPPGWRLCSLLWSFLQSHPDPGLQAVS